MKLKFFLIASIAGLLAVANQTKAQNTTTLPKTTFGIRAGINFYNINGKDETGASLDNRLLPGFNAGINVEVPFAQDWYLQPGLMYIGKGGKSRNSLGQDIKTHLNYLELPVNFIYKPELGNGKLLLGAGPYVALGVGGKVKGPNGAEWDVKFKGTADPNDQASFYYKKVDAGFGLLAGYEFSNRLSFQLNAELGLVNNSPYQDQSKYKNTGFGVSVGYRF